MAVGANALTTFAKLQTAFGYDSADQAKIETIVDIATARMELYAKRPLKARDFTDQIIDGPGTARLVFPAYPLNTVTKLNPDATRAFAVGTELSSTAYTIRTEAGIVLLFEGDFPEGPAVIKTTYNAGYAATHSYYPALEAACNEVVNWMLTRWAGFIGKRTETNADGMNVGYEIELPVNVTRLLDDLSSKWRV